MITGKAGLYDNKDSLKFFLALCLLITIIIIIIIFALNESKIKICPSGVRVKCNLLGMLGRGKKGSARTNILLHCPILGKRKPKQRLLPPQTELPSGVGIVLFLQSVQLIPFGGRCTICISSFGFLWLHALSSYLQTL